MGIVKTSVKMTRKGGFPGGPMHLVLKAHAKGLNGAFVTVGVHDDAGMYPGTDTSVAEVAAASEFGTERIPERSFMRSALAENESALQKKSADVFSEMNVKKASAAKGLKALGLTFQKMVQAKIQSNIGPANAESTLARKKALKQGSNTLIATRLLLQSISFKVTVPAEAVEGEHEAEHGGGTGEGGEA